MGEPAERTWEEMQGWTLALLFAGVVAVVVIARPDPTPILATPAIVKFHLLTAIAALCVGAILMARPKGQTFHRIAGWTWVLLISAVALSSFFITVVRPGHFSSVHIVSGLTLVALPFAVLAARKHRVKIHRGVMFGLFYAALVMEGASAFLPGRLLHRVFLG